MQLERQNVDLRVKLRKLKWWGWLLSSSCGGYFGVSYSFNVIYHQYSIVSLKTVAKFVLVSKLNSLGSMNFVELKKTNCQLFVRTQRKRFWILDEVDEDSVNFVCVIGKVLQSEIEDESAIALVNKLIIGVYAFSLKLPENLIDLVSEMKSGEKNFWVARPNMTEEFCNPITSKYFKYLFVCSGQCQFQMKRVMKQILRNLRYLGFSSTHNLNSRTNSFQARESAAVH